MVTLCTTCWAEIDDRNAWCPVCGFEVGAGSRRHFATLLLRLRGPRPGRRGSICRVLGLQKDARAVPALLERLKDRDPGVRVAAIRALTEIGAAEAIELLGATAVEDGHCYVRAVANDALKSFKQRTAGASLKRTA
jgi:HEAT repeat protein